MGVIRRGPCPGEDISLIVEGGNLVKANGDLYSPGSPGPEIAANLLETKTGRESKGLTIEITHLSPKATTSATSTPDDVFATPYKGNHPSFLQDHDGEFPGYASKNERLCSKA